MKYPWTAIQHLDEPYDIGSVMHYGTRAFAKSKSLKTMQAKDPSLNKYLGQRRRLSKIDIAKINKLYDCENEVILKADSFSLNDFTNVTTTTTTTTSRSSTETFADKNLVPKTPVWETIFQFIFKLFE